MSRSRASTRSAWTCWRNVLQREARANGVAVVFSSHQLELVERLCDEVVLIDHGKIAARGTIDELHASRDRNLWRVEVRGGDGTWWDVVPGVTFVSGDGDAAVLDLAASTDPQRVLDVARGAGDVVSFGAVRLTLAELFREVVA